MKIIDCDVKGNAVRYYLGKDNLDGWFGDDWDNRGCQDTVYDNFVSEVVDKTYDYKDSVFSIFDLMNEDEISKEMLQNRAYPMLIICHNVDVKGKEKEGWKIYNYRTAMEWKDKTVIFMGDKFKGICEFEEGNNKS